MARLQGALLLLGLGLVFFAYARYLHRTGDWGGVLRFWTRGMALSITEFKIQRAGLLVLILAVAVRFCQVLFQW